MLYPLNRSEQGYLAMEGVAGSILQPYLMVLDSPVSAEVARRAARTLVGAYDRLRAIVVPGWHLHAFRVLPDDALMDELFELAWRQVDHVDAQDPAAVEAWHNQLLNEVVSLEHGLGLRVYFVPHEQTPLLVLSVHHVLLDGRSMLYALSDLLTLLNGGTVGPRPMEAPSLVGAIAPRRWQEWPARLWAAWQHMRDQGRERKGWTVARIPRREAHHYTANAVLHHVLPASSEVIHAAAKRHKTTVNTLMLVALAEAIREQQGSGLADEGAAVVIRLSVDLRRYFPRGQMPEVGNFVGSFTVASPRSVSLPEHVLSMDRQSRQGLGHFMRREMSAGYLLEEALSRLGRTLYGHLLRRVIRSGALDSTSAHLSTLGVLDSLNAPDAAIKVATIFPTAVSMITVLVGTVELAGRMLVTVSWQRCEREPQTLRDLLARMDRHVMNLTSAGC